jgi:23S rRNA (guanine745-N1)-methyltransferase
VCAAGHSYDIARAGYVNLLQPQDRRSRTAGDAKDAIDARAALLAAGVGRTLVDALATRVSLLTLRDEAVVVDLGCGAGDVLAAVAERHPITGIGIDLSTAAVDRAARRFPRETWVVANADRRLPLLDRSVDLVVSVHGRRNPPEVARVLRAEAQLIVALPASDDLIELRTLVQGEGLERDRGEAMLVEHETQFQLIERTSVRETRDLDRDRLLQLLRGTYRGLRRGTAEAVAALTEMRVTLASDIFLLRLR